MIWAGAFAAVVFASLIGYAVFRWAGSPRVEWVPVPGFKGAKCRVPPGVSPGLVAAMLDRATISLMLHGPWNAAKVTALVNSDIHVYVMDSDAWVDLWGRPISGSQVGHTLAVGRNLAALCHELAHLAESVLDGAVDESHEKWPSRGIRAAEADYESKLGA